MCGNKSNKIPTLRELPKPLDLDGVVVSTDAMHTQTDTAEWITQQGGQYVLTPLGNQKILRRTLKKLPWKDVPSTSWGDVSHGRRVRRTANGPENIAVLRNLAISLIRLFHGPSACIASATRSLSRQPKRAIELLTQPTT